MFSLDRTPARVHSSPNTPDDPEALFAQLVKARRDRDVKTQLGLRRALLALGWSISPVAPKIGGRP
jgi:hypothetical protein